MSAFSYIKAKLLQLGRLKAIDTYVESESIIVYEPDRIISEIPFNGLITYQNAVDLLDGAVNNTLPIQLPAGSPIPFVFTDLGAFATNINGYNQFIKIEDNINDIYTTTPIYDIELKTFYTDNSYSVVTKIEISGHEDPDNPGFTIDDVIIVLVK